MKISRTALLDKVNQAIKKHREDWDKQQEEKRTQKTGHDALWEKEYGPVWDEVIKVMTAARKKKQPIRHDMLPASYDKKLVSNHIYICAYYNMDPYLDTYTPPQALLQTKALLEMITDDEVNTSSIKVYDVLKLLA